MEKQEVIKQKEDEVYQFCNKNNALSKEVEELMEKNCELKTSLIKSLMLARKLNETELHRVAKLLNLKGNIKSK